MQRRTYSRIINIASIADKEAPGIRITLRGPSGSPDRYLCPNDQGVDQL
jgi:hypothetical protein